VWQELVACITGSNEYCVKFLGLLPGGVLLMKVVVLCGGQGTRLREETEFRPKPMVEVGGASDSVAHHEGVWASWPERLRDVSWLSWKSH
jgi:hypothetical protein